MLDVVSTVGGNTPAGHVGVPISIRIAVELPNPARRLVTAIFDNVLDQFSGCVSLHVPLKFTGDVATCLSCESGLGCSFTATAHAKTRGIRKRANLYLLAPSAVVMVGDAPKMLSGNPAAINVGYGSQRSFLSATALAHARWVQNAQFTSLRVGSTLHNNPLSVGRWRSPREDRRLTLVSKANARAGLGQPKQCIRRCHGNADR